MDFPAPKLLVLGLLVALAPTALAEGEPALNETDTDTSVPPADESYLDDSSPDSAQNASPGSSAGGADDETLDEREMDATVPPPDVRYLNDDADAYPPEPRTSAPGAPAPPRAEAPAVAWGALAALAVGALGARSRR